MKIGIGNDHAAVDMKNQVVEYLEGKGYEVVNFGTDTYEGLLASILMSCSETIFYTISVYLLATGNNKEKPFQKTGWILPGALVCTLAGMIASVIIVKIMEGLYACKMIADIIIVKIMWIMLY